MSIDAHEPLAEALRRTIRDVPNFPQVGILFRDLTPLFADAALFGRAVDAIAAPFAAERVTRVAAIESRGFIFGAPVAERLGVGFVPIRKAGKLPHRTVAVAYALEYGEAILEMHADAVDADDRVLIVDDVLATGGTAAAAVELVERCGGTVVGIAFALEIVALRGAARLDGVDVHALLSV